MKRMTACVVGMALLAFVVGCEWETTSSGGSWNSDYNWVNFDGVYRAPNGGIMVTSFGTSGGTETVDQRASDEPQGSGNGGTSYGGTLNNWPVREGSVDIYAGGFHLRDNGDGTLSDPDSSPSGGTITYSTGAWTINLAGSILSSQNITASYVYTVGGSTATATAGNTGTPIYSLTVHHEGNLLSMTASDGTVFSGRLGSVRSTSGDVLATQEGVIVAQFEAEAPGIRIIGTFQGTMDSGILNVMFDRQMAGTWLEDGGATADIIGVAPNIGVELPEPDFDDRPDFETTP